MATNRDSEREYDSPVPGKDLPAGRHGVGREDDHRNGDDEAKHEREPEAAQDFGYLKPEVGTLDFLLRGAPLDVVREEVREQGLR